MPHIDPRLLRANLGQRQSNALGKYLQGSQELHQRWKSLHDLQLYAMTSRILNLKDNLKIYFFGLQCAEVYKSSCSTLHHTKEKAVASHALLSPMITYAQGGSILIILAYISSSCVSGWLFLFITVMLKHSIGWI